MGQKTTLTMLDALGGRKFLFALLLIGIGVVFVLLNKTTADSFFTFATIVGGTYVVGNVASNITGKFGPTSEQQ